MVLCHHRCLTADALRPFLCRPPIDPPRASSRPPQAAAAARRMLKLRHCVRDTAAVSRERYISACARLAQFSLILGPLMEGLSIRVSDAARAEPGGEFIDIPWDFQLRKDY